MLMKLASIPVMFCYLVGIVVLDELFVLSAPNNKNAMKIGTFTFIGEGPVFLIQQRIKKEPLPKFFLIMGLSGSLFIS